MSISKKLLITVTIGVLLITGAVAGIMYYDSAAYSDSVSAERVSSALSDLQGQIDVWLESSKNSALLLAGNASVVRGVQSGNFALLQQTLDALNEELGLSTISVTDAAGNVIIRQHQPEKFGDNIANQSNVQKALEGEVQTTIEPGKLVKLSTRAGAPVIDENGKIIGTIVVGYTFENAEALSALKTLHSTDFAIYMGTERISTTIFAADGTLALGDALDSKEAEVYEANAAFYGKNTVDGVKYICRYEPLKDTNGQTVGVLFAGLPVAKADEAKSALMLHAAVAVPVLEALVVAVLALLLRRMLKKPLEAVTRASASIANGDLNVTLVKRSQDEIGQLTESFAKMAETLKTLLGEVTLLARAAAEGDLSAKAEEERYQGSYRELVEGLNRLVEESNRPVEEAAQVLGALHAGELSARMTGRYEGAHNNIKYALNQSMENLQTLIHALSTAAQGMAQGDFSQRIEAKFEGDFVSLKDAFNATLESISRTMTQIRRSAEQVAAGTQQVSMASQAISTGAMNQAASVEMLTGIVSEVHKKTESNAMSAQEAKSLATAAQKAADEGNTRMVELQQAMQEISAASENIGAIMKSINDIAFQTNILAFNASVEAARAGAAGKGFAVVAEEVRNLAAKSAESARETEELIETAANKAHAGKEIAGEAAQSLLAILQGVKDTGSLVTTIAASSDEQAKAIRGIDQSVERISHVVQDNSATAQQTAATTQELSGQADLLREMVAGFKVLT